MLKGSSLDFVDSFKTKNVSLLLLHLEAVAEIHFVYDYGNWNQGKITELEGLSTVDLPIKVAGLVKKVKDIFNLKRADLNTFVQGGQPYWGLPL